MLVEVQEWEFERPYTFLYNLSATIKFKEIDSEGRILSSGKFNVSEVLRSESGILDNENVNDLINEVAVGIAKKLMEGPSQENTDNVGKGGELPLEPLLSE